MLQIKHLHGAYEVKFLDIQDALAQLPEDVKVITDSNVHALYGVYFQNFDVLVLPAGEQSKSMSGLEQCLEFLAQKEATRTTTVLAFGGGVIGDLAGFAAATYMRGVPYIQMPTTLLAQVDSSVGGKVAIDLKAGKNLAGAFYPPKAVFLCLDVLRTLDQRQWKNGMAEVWKYGYISDASFLDELRAGLANRDLASMARRCLETKAAIVQQDEFETTGVRAILNFGHTIGHAIEQATAYRSYLHGEAISIGMVAEARLGEILGITPPGVADAIANDLQNEGLPVKLETSLSPDVLLTAMMRDKKRSTPELAFSLLTRYGGCKLVKAVSTDSVMQVLKEL